MKHYKYIGDGLITFSHEGNDHAVHGPGPHELPEESEVVKANVAIGKLEEVKDKPKRTQA